MKVYYTNDNGEKGEVSEQIMQVIEDWIGIELIKVASFGHFNDIPLEVMFNIFSRTVDTTIANMLGGNEHE